MSEQQPLPTPATGAEIFSHAAVMELRRLNQNIESLIDTLKPSEPETATEDVPLREPKPSRTAHRDAKKAADEVASDAMGPVTVETKEPGEPATVEIVEPDKPAKASKK